MLYGEQIRAARGLIRWSAKDLADRAKVSLSTVQRAEQADGPVAMMPANLDVIRRALETAGVEFIDPNGGGPGVRMRDNPNNESAN